MFTKAGIEKYFLAEKKTGLLFAILGVAAIAMGLYFLIFLKTSFYKGMAMPFLILGLLLLIVGFTLFKRSDADRIRIVYAYDMNPAELKNIEIPRMNKVIKNFHIYRYVEFLLFLVGAALYIFFIRDIKHDFWRGFGLALAIMSLLVLVIDYFAEKRGHAYYRGLSDFSNKL
jgi:hypothetical protein